MPYDEELAGRVRAQLDARPDLVERKMFGGIAFMLGGNMACGVLGDELIARIPADEGEAALEQPGVRPFDFTGRAMKGFVVVSSSLLETDDDLDGWVVRCEAYASSLPAK